MIWMRALALGWGDLFRPSVFGLVLRGIGLTILLFLALHTVLFWGFREFISGEAWLPFIGDVPLGSLLGWGSLILLPFVGIFLMAPVAAAFSGFYADRVAGEVEATHYPRRQGASPDFWDSLLESAAIMGAVLLVTIATLLATPILGPLAPVVFYGANGWLLGREFFQMAANRHMESDAASALRRQNAATVTMLGIAIAFALTVPILNIAIPVLAAAAFTHLFQIISE
ncbi:EI24 domain-containing protein [Paracoccus albus]|uniref:EI24 domain-containing protein n=1 Tax=Paracoccus albus TaxID=3017784 RepID=UPI0022F0FC42|nr:EI24 domain-containing protein [Paracoccus albus]WBU59539.1 EI24 domain-containing protein [Paracoccus albus]